MLVRSEVSAKLFALKLTVATYKNDIIFSDLGSVVFSSILHQARSSPRTAPTLGTQDFQASTQQPAVSPIPFRSARQVALLKTFLSIITGSEAKSRLTHLPVTYYLRIG
jgi:hypothetical protein